MAFQPLKILAIDDEEESLSFLNTILERYFPGIRRFSALKGSDGLKCALQEKPDLIFLDISMPEMDGFEVCRRLKADARTNGIPIVFLTGAGTDRKKRVKALDAGGEGFLGKPFDEAELVAKIRAIVKIRAATIALRKRVSSSAQQEGEIKYQASLDVSPIPMALNDEHQCIKFLNKAFINTFGYTHGDIPTLADWWLKAYPDAKHRKQVSEAWDKELQRCKITGTAFSPMEVSITCKDGKIKVVLVSAALPSKAFDGQYLVILYDITEHKQAELYGDISREILEILNKSGDLQYTLGRVVTAFKARLGYAAVGVRLQEGEDFPYAAQEGFPGDFLLTENSIMERSPSGGACRDKNGNISLECTCGLVISGKTDASNPFCTKGGSFWTNDSLPLLDLPSDQDPRHNPRNQCIHKEYASVALVPIRANGRIVGLLQLNDKKKGCFTPGGIGVLENIAAHIGEALIRKQSEETLKRAEGKYRSLAENSPDLIARFDRQLKHLYVNKAAAAAGKLSPEAYVGLTLKESGVPEPEALKWENRVKAVFNTGHSLEVEDEFNTPQGRQYFMTEFVPEPASDGTIQSVLSIARNITERKLATLEREEMQNKLRHSQKMESVGRLAGGVAHDFNNLLTAIVGYSGMLLSGLPPDDQKRDDIVEILSAAEKATALTRQLLAFSRKQILSPQIVDLNAAVAGITKMLKRLIGEDIKLEASLAARACFIKVDSGQLDQVVVNLAVNARDAMPKGGTLALETEILPPDETFFVKHPDLRRGPLVRLNIRDTGCGMTESVRDRIFEPFFTTKEKGRGTGLGLATVFGIIKQSGGEIQVKTEPGHGTTFSVFFPLTEGAAKDTHKCNDKHKDVLLSGTETILLVEDEETLRRLAERMLRSCGYAVITACDGKAALEAAMAYGKPIDLLLTDVVMPGLSGRELAKELNSRKLVRKTLYMSGYPDDAIVEQGVLAPGISFLYKPFTADALSLKLREVLDGPEEKAKA